MSTSSSTFTAPRGTPGKARGSVEGLNQVCVIGCIVIIVLSYEDTTRHGAVSWITANPGGKDQFGLVYHKLCDTD